MTSPLITFFRPNRYFRIENREVCLQPVPGDSIRHLQIGNRLRGCNLVDPYNCFNRTTCTRGYFTPKKLTRQILKFLKSGQASNSSFLSVLLLGSCLSLHLLWLLNRNMRTLCVDVPVSPEHAVVFCELLRWTGKHATNDLGSTLSSKWCHQYPLCHNL